MDFNNQFDFSNTAGPSLLDQRHNISFASVYQPRLERLTDSSTGKALNHANFYVQNGDGINQLQYNPIGTNCGDGQTLNQTCYLVRNSGPGNFGTYQEVNPDGQPRALQFSLRSAF